MMENSFLVRPAETDDAEKVYRLLTVIAEMHRNGRPDMFPELQSKYTFDEVKERLARLENGVFVADIDKNAVGYIICDIIKEGNGHTLYIDDLCVDPSCRGKGVATALMDHAASYGKENGCRYLMLNVWEFNSGALEFYAKYGFQTRSRHLEKPL